MTTRFDETQRLGLRGGHGRWPPGAQCHAWRHHRTTSATSGSHRTTFAPFAGRSTSPTGGYDPSRDVLDDQDLMCRLFQLTDFHLIDECLYLQRMHKANTQREQRSTHGSRSRPSPSTTATSSRTRSPGPSAAGSCRSTWAPQQQAHGYLGVARPRDRRGSRGTCQPRPRPPRLEPSGVIRAIDFLELCPTRSALFNEFYRLLAHGGLLLILPRAPTGAGRSRTRRMSPSTTRTRSGITPTANSCSSPRSSTVSSRSVAW